MEKKYACPVCGNYTLRRNPNLTHEICPVCYWEDDPLHLDDPDFTGGGNQLSLRKAQQNYQEFGVNRLADLPFIRQALPRELPENQIRRSKKKKRIFWMSFAAIIGALALFVKNYIVLAFVVAAMGLQIYRMLQEKKFSEKSE